MTADHPKSSLAEARRQRRWRIAVKGLPRPVVISDLFGVSSSTAHKWAQFA